MESPGSFAFVRRLPLPLAANTAMTTLPEPPSTMELEPIMRPSCRDGSVSSSAPSSEILINCQMRASTPSREQSQMAKGDSMMATAESNGHRVATISTAIQAADAGTVLAAASTRALRQLLQW